MNEDIGRDKRLITFALNKVSHSQHKHSHSGFVSHFFLRCGVLVLVVLLNLRTWAHTNVIRKNKCKCLIVYAYMYGVCSCARAMTIWITMGFCETKPSTQMMILLLVAYAWEMEISSKKRNLEIMSCVK